MLMKRPPSDMVIQAAYFGADEFDIIRRIDHHRWHIEEARNLLIQGVKLGPGITREIKQDEQAIAELKARLMLG